MVRLRTDRAGTPRRWRAGFRLRVLGFAALLLLGAAAAEMFVQRAVLLERLDRRVTESLDQEKAELDQLAAGRDPATGEPFASDVAAIFDTFLVRNVPAAGEVFLTFVDGEPYQRTVAPIALDSDPAIVARWSNLTEGERGEISTSEGPVRYLAVPLEVDGEVRGVFVVANFMAAERAAIATDIRVRAGAVGVVSVLALGAAWLTAGRLLRPLREVTATAKAITETDLTRRIPVEGNDEIAEMAETFNEMLERLETAFATQRSFVDDAGHELRTPITVIMGQLELMGDDPEDRARTLAVVDDELARMARMVEDLLLLAKSDQPDFLRTEPVELTDLTTEMLVKARALGPRDWLLDACADGIVALDPQRITQAVLNLARNAVEHAPDGAAVWIGSELAGDRVRFWVRDDGPGVPVEERDRIFDRFARGRGERRRSDGAGLGLSIVSAIAHAHGGEVRVTGGPGEGATFVLDLPVTDREALAVADPELDAPDRPAPLAPPTREVHPPSPPVGLGDPIDPTQPMGAPTDRFARPDADTTLVLPDPPRGD